LNQEQDVNKKGQNPVLLMDNITKIYKNGFIANQNVTFSVEKGEIHALMGENGAGKTTLMKVLFGIETPEEGRILINGNEVRIQNPQHAIALGIGMVHQHFMLVPSLTVAENMVLGMEPKTFGRVGLLDFANAVSQTREISKKYNFSIDPEARVKDLPVGTKQKVEILKALLRGAQILILDEPTAVLTPQETDELFVQLKLLKERGHTIIFISHKLDEIKSICDRITILRHGKWVGTRAVMDVSKEDISRMMVGRDVVLKFEKTPARPTDTVLEIENVGKVDEEGKRILHDINLRLRRGEILGVAGIEGNGQKELSEAITGMDRFDHGDIRVSGQSLKNRSVRAIREIGVSHVSEDRMTYGCAQNASVWENVISDRYYKNPFSSNHLLKMNTIKDVTQKLKEIYTIKCDNINQPVKMLSGGNIQKVVVAREFSAKSDLIVANQPTRGIDVGATELIRKELVRLTREENKAVLLISADLNEVMELSDSLMIMHEGQIVGYFANAADVTEYELGLYMLGERKQSADQIRSAIYEH